MMKLVTGIIIVGITLLMAKDTETISKITPEVKKRMIQGHSWRKGCPVPLENLRYLTIKYIDFNGDTQHGEMIVHKSVASDVVSIFNKLYQIQYPIRKMKLVSVYKGSDWQSIEADNTSAFNCRNATGSKKWSKHSYGKAIDLNPIENPYISRSGRIAHKASLQYRRREHTLDMRPENWALLLKNDQATQIFKKYGWKWGGEWSGVKDYQHFSK